MLVMLGLFYRVAIVALTVSFGYFFLLDKAEYLNHFYLVILFLILMCVLPAHRMLSLDAWLRRGVRRDHVPYAAVFILRAQMEVMLIFAGLVKLTPDWLAGEPLGLWLRRQADDFPFGFLFQYDSVILAGTWSTVALQVLGAPLLLWHRTQLATCVFHAANAMVFNIGIFSVADHRGDDDLPHARLAAPSGMLAAWPVRGPAALRAKVTGAARTLPGFVLAGILGWIAVQVAFPLRAAAYPTEVRWSGDGHRFSWRMRIYDRRAEGAFIVTADGRDWIVDPTDYLTGSHRPLIVVAPSLRPVSNPGPQRGDAQLSMPY